MVGRLFCAGVGDLGFCWGRVGGVSQDVFSQQGACVPDTAVPRGGEVQRDRS